MFKGPLSSTNAVVRKVSHDVWWYIFVLFYRQSSKGTLEIIRLSHVCSLWRAIISDTSELWTNVEVKVYLAHDSPYTVPKVELLSRILRNSRDKPLKMTLTRAFSANTTKRMAKMLVSSSARMFLQAMDRARELILDFAVLESLFRFETHRFGAVQTTVSDGRFLEKLSVNVASDAAGVIPLISRLWTPAPSLHAFRFYGGEIDELDIQAFRLSHFPFQQLTTLEFETAIDVHVAFRILHQVPSLVTLRFDSIYGDLDEDPALQVATFPELQTFRLGGLSLTDDDDATPRPLGELLDFLILPSLTTLHLSLTREWSLESFLTFIRKSDSPHIEHFQPDIADLTETDKLKCLKVLTHLRTLDLRIQIPMADDEANHGGAFCAAMREWDASLQAFAICPNLEQLMMDYGSLNDTTTTIFADMIEDRWRRSQNGRRFELVLRGAPDPDDPEADQANLSEIRRLVMLKRLGLSVTFEDAPEWVKHVLALRTCVPSETSHVESDHDND